MSNQKENKKPKYQSPVIESLGEMGKGAGYCNPVGGSVTAGACKAGPNAADACEGNGTSAGNACTQTGTDAKTGGCAQDGVTAGGACAANGTLAGGACGVGGGGT